MSGFVNTKLYAPNDASAATDTVNVNDDADTPDTDSTVTPEPENDADTPSTKSEPDTTTDRLVAPRPNTDGDNNDATGLAVTVNADTNVATPLSGFVNVRSRPPNAAPDATDTLNEIDDDEPNVTEFTVTPLSENTADTPSWNPLPDTTTVWLLAP